MIHGPGYSYFNFAVKISFIPGGDHVLCCLIIPLLVGSKFAFVQLNERNLELQR